MRNVWLIARHQFLTTAGRRSFLFGALAVPLGLAALVGAIILVVSLSESDLPLGYVDQAGRLRRDALATLPPDEVRLEIRAFDDEGAGRQALESEQIQALFVVPAGYPAERSLRVITLAKPLGGNARDDFEAFLRANLVAGLPAGAQTRLLEGPQLAIHDQSTGREFSQEQALAIAVPIAASLLFFVAAMIAAGYMLKVVADEKENRTMEIMITTVDPGQLIGGKAIGLLAAVFGLLFIYLLAALLGLRLAADLLPDLGRLTIPWGHLAVVALFFLPAFAIITGMMIALGGAVTDFQQGQQVAGVLNLFFLAPLFIVPLIISEPESPLVVAMTLFPTTSPLTVSLRWGLGSVPAWQLLLAWLLLVATAGFCLWAAARIFRAGMLRYGQTMSLRGTLAALRG
ncbi:MAG: ABC transporter permease [Candidatus Promineifilaceae bacterium]